ncbi:MAG: Mrp/NBP35 family ATP-binding protein [Candidatus Protochlamydia sp.]|nr:Mrp/NBP35 family ATP-binding protein [Candidatus Protochlamydia sp.]
MPLPLLKSSLPLSSIKYTLAVAAGKGGVGKSTMTVNLALALRENGYRVGVMDTDLYGPSIRKMLPEDRMPRQNGEIIEPALCQGIKMISIAYFRKEQEATAVRAPIANGLIGHFIKNVAWGELDFLLIDFPPGTGDIQLTLGQKANLTAALIVTTPQEVAVLDVKKAMYLFEQVKVPILGIVENMSGYFPVDGGEPVYLFGKGGGEKLARESGSPFLGAIPLDPIVCACCDKGESLFASDPNAQKLVTQAFIKLARQVDMHSQALKSALGSSLSPIELVWKEMGF